MPLPNLPARTAQEDLADQTKDLNKQLDLARASMAGMSAADLPAILQQLAKVAQAADKAGPALEGLFKLNPAAARSLKEQFQSVIDKAAEMGEAARDSADKANAAGKHKAARFIQGGGGGVSGAVNSVGGLAGPEGEIVAATINAVASAIQGAADALKGFVESSVEAANPGVWERYQRSVEDSGAVFGQAFTPIIELATQLTDQLNGALSEIAPVVGDIAGSIASDLGPVIEAVLPLIQEWIEGFKAIWQDIAPSFKDAMRSMAAVIVILVKNVQILINALGQMAKGLSIHDAFAKAAQMQKELEDKAKGLAGQKTFAARPASFGEIEDIGKQAQLAAASAGTGAKPVEDSAAEIATIAGTIQGKLNEWGEKLAKIADGVATIAGAIHNPVGAAKDAIAAPAAGLAAAIVPLLPMFGL